MVRFIAALGVLSLSFAAVLPGCVGDVEDDVDTAEPQEELVTSGTAEESAQAEAVAEEEQEVNSAGQCCYIKCAGDNYNGWYGPYGHVKSGNCHSWGVFKCGQWGYGLQNTQWDKCI